jgi:glycosyltransferase involved in cell wall biosynthesis
VLNSRYEGLSHTLLEVKALGTPIVASRVCGNPEVVEHGVDGRLVDPASPPELARAVRLLLEDPDLAARYVHEGLARTARFSRAETFAEVEAALLRAAGRTRSVAGAAS